MTQKSEKPVSGHLSSVTSHRGSFTLIEALIVIMVTMLMTSILITQSRTSNKQIILFKEQAVLISTLSRAKSLAIGTFQPSLTTGSQTEKICGWGVHFPADGSNTYVLFKDLASAGASPSCANEGSYSSGEDFETFTIDPAVFITALSPGGSALDIVFRPPQPKVLINGSETIQDASITLGIPGSGSGSTVVVSQGGQVSVE